MSLRLSLIILCLLTPIIGFSATCVGTALPPVAFLIDKIGGAEIRSLTLLGAGQNPHSFSLSPKKTAELIGCPLYISIDFPLEQKFISMLQSNHSKTKVILATKGVTRLSPVDQDEHHHDHQGEEDHHEHHDDLTDPHVWVNPSNLLMMAKIIYDSLKKELPLREKNLSSNYSQLVKELEALKKRVDARLIPLKEKIILVYHPSILYLTAPYQIDLRSIESEGKAPSAKQLSQLMELAKKSQTKLILIDAHQDQRQVARIVEILKIKSQTINPLDYNIVEAIDSISKIIAEEGGNSHDSRRN